MKGIFYLSGLARQKNEASKMHLGCICLYFQLILFEPILCAILCPRDKIMNIMESASARPSLREKKSSNSQ